MLRVLLTLVFAVSLLLVGSAGHGATTPATAVSDTMTVQGLGAFTPAALNNAGDVAGTVPVDGLWIHAALWQDGGAADLGTLGGNLSAAIAINDAGQVAGWSLTNEGGIRAFRTRSPAPLDDTTDVFGGTGQAVTFAYGINRAGQVTGVAYDQRGIEQGFLYDGTLRSLGGPCENCGSSPYDVNATGTAAGLGYFEPAPNALPEEAPAYWDGAWHALPTLCDGCPGKAIALNDAGVIVGHGDRPATGLGAAHAEDPILAVRGRSGAIEPLGTLGGTSSEALAINRWGDIVGWSLLPDGEERAFLYRNGTMIDLNDLLPPDSGWVLEEAIDINDNGQIVGIGNLGGFLLSPAASGDSPAGDRHINYFPFVGRAGGTGW